MNNRYLKFLVKTGCALVCLSFPLHALSLGYGIYDARGQAMGGAGVASAGWHSAQYYNPSLLALHRQREDDSLSGRVVFPNFVVSIDASAEDVADAAQEDLDQRLRAAVNAYNADSSAINAAAIADNARELDALLSDLANEDVGAEAFLSFSVSEPSLFEGGAFYIGVRTLGFASSVIPPEDRGLLADYITALDIVAEGGDTASIPASIVDDTGNLLDPTELFNSTADLSSMVISEWAVAVAKRFDVFGQGIAVGVTPKVQRVDVFRETTDFDADELDFLDSQETAINLNADLGVALELFDHYRIGLAVKDIVPETFTTQNDLVLTLEPRPRLGLAYVSERISIGVDMDLQENAAVAVEAPTQEAGFGIEVLPLKSLALRLGYRHDMTGVQSGVASAGLGYRIGRAVLEVSYVNSSDVKGAGLQFGWLF